MAAILFATSCQKDNNDPDIEDEVFEYDVVPYSITVGITPMSDKIDGVELKTKYISGDAIVINNYKILAEPAILTSDDCTGKDKATFSGELKVKRGMVLTSGSTTLTASLKNVASPDTLYNNGKPFMDAREASSLKYVLDRYSYWACENFTYNADATSINLEQKTVFVEMDMPVPGAKIMMKSGRAHCTITIPKHSFIAVPYGTEIVCPVFQIDKKLDAKGQILYKVAATLPKDCIPGLFSVGEDTQVLFSKGNLQYRPNDGTWRLAPQQYHTCFNRSIDVGNNHSLWSDVNDWTDLFGWGTWIAGYNNPATTSKNILDYMGRTDDNNNLMGTCAFGAEWSVLSPEQWDYVYNGRDPYQKYGFAKINDVEGLVLIPDDWTTPANLSFYNIAPVNEYNTEDWQKMEAAGAVFFPTAGYRTGTSVNINQWGAYWTTNAYDDEATSVFEFNPEMYNSCFPSTQEYRFLGVFVRLVYGLPNTTSDNPDTPDNPDNPIINEDRCIVVTSKDNAQNSWDSQFWIVTNGFQKGQTFEISMSVKADYEAYSYIPQIHLTPGSYIGSLLQNGNVYFTTEWTTAKLSGTFDYDGLSIAFNLNDDDRANKYYFDNLSLKIDGQEVVTNGDCQSDDISSFLKKDGGSSYSYVKFIDKESITPAKPRDEREMTPGETVFTLDYTTWTEYPYHIMEENNYVPGFNSTDGLVIYPPLDDNGNVKWYEFHAADGIPTVKDKKYSVKVEIRGDEAGSFNANLVWDWSQTPASTTIEYSTEWETKEFMFDMPSGSNAKCRLIFQPGDLPYTIYVRNLKIIYQGE